MKKYENLDILASFAAIGIDSHINKRAKKENYSNVKELANKLEEFSKEQLDPTGLSMFSEVIWLNHEDLKGKTEDDVYQHISSLAEDLARFEKFPQKRQEELRDICVRLSKRSASYKLRFSM
jgi:hypothetical protein